MISEWGSEIVGALIIVLGIAAVATAGYYADRQDATAEKQIVQYHCRAVAASDDHIIYACDGGRYFTK